MAKRRRFTAKFKAEVVREALTGDSSQAELCPHPQGRRSPPQRLPRYYRGSTKHRSFSHTGI